MNGVLDGVNGHEYNGVWKLWKLVSLGLFATFVVAFLRACRELERIGRQPELEDELVDLYAERARLKRLGDEVCNSLVSYHATIQVPLDLHASPRARERLHKAFAAWRTAVRP